MAAFYFPLTLIDSGSSTQFASSYVSFSRFFHPSHKLAFVGFSGFPSRIGYPAAFTTCDLYHASPFLVVQVMLVPEIYIICCFKDFFLRQGLCIPDPFFQCLLPTFIFSFFCLSSGGNGNVILFFHDIVPPPIFVPCPGFTEVFYPAHIIFTLEDVLLFLVLPCISAFLRQCPDQSSTATVRLNLLF